MNLGEAFRVALDALRANRMRSILTMLGVIIGVAAVVILVAIGSGAKQEVEQQVEGLGSNIIIVVPGRFEFGSAPSVSRLTLDDVDLLGRVVGDRDRVAVSIASGETVRVGSREAFVTVNGVNESVPNVFNRPLARGEYITETDVDTRRRVAVLGSSVVRKVFGDVDPLGRQVSDRRRAVPGDRGLRRGRLDVRRRPRRRDPHPGHRSAAAVRCRAHRRARREGADLGDGRRRCRSSWSPPCRRSTPARSSRRSPRPRSSARSGASSGC